MYIIYNLALFTKKTVANMATAMGIRDVTSRKERLNYLDKLLAELSEELSEELSDDESVESVKPAESVYKRTFFSPRVTPKIISRLLLPAGFRYELIKGNPHSEHDNLTETSKIMRYASLVYGTHFKLVNLINWSHTLKYFKDITLHHSIFTQTINYLRGTDDGEKLEEEPLLTYEAFKPDEQKHTTTVNVSCKINEDGSRGVFLSVLHGYCFSHGCGRGFTGFANISDPKIIEQLKYSLEVLDTL